MPSWKDFAKEAERDEATVKIEEVVDKPILIINWSLLPSKYADNKMYLRFEFQDKQKAKDDPFSKAIFVCNTSSTVLIKQIQEYDVPESFSTTIIRKKGSGDRTYYSFS